MRDVDGVGEPSTGIIAGDGDATMRRVETRPARAGKRETARHRREDSRKERKKANWMGWVKKRHYEGRVEVMPLEALNDWFYQNDWIENNTCESNQW